MTDADTMIRQLQLARHPEGGWYRETWRAPAAGAARSAATAVLFLLEAGERSHWHRVDASELWIFQGGTPPRLQLAEGRRTETFRLGLDILAGHRPQQLVQPQQWQSAQAGDGWCLISCVVVPAFHFDGLELAPPGWTPAAGPPLPRIDRPTATGAAP